MWIIIFDMSWFQDVAKVRIIWMVWLRRVWPTKSLPKINTELESLCKPGIINKFISRTSPSHSISDVIIPSTDVSFPCGVLTSWCFHLTILCSFKYINVPTSQQLPLSNNAIGLSRPSCVTIVNNALLRKCVHVLPRSLSFSTFLYFIPFFLYFLLMVHIEGAVDVKVCSADQCRLILPESQEISTSLTFPVDWN